MTAAHSPTPIPRTAATVSEAEVEAEARSAAVRLYGEDIFDRLALVTRDRLRSEAAAAMRVASPVEEGAQPVAWEWKGPDSAYWWGPMASDLNDLAIREGWTSRPVYAASPPDTRRAENDEGEARRKALEEARREERERCIEELRKLQYPFPCEDPRAWALEEGMGRIRALAAEPRR